MKMTFDKGSRVLPELAIGDKVRIQNQTTLRKIKWDRTGMITDILRDRQYSILVKGSWHHNLNWKNQFQSLSLQCSQVLRVQCSQIFQPPKCQLQNLFLHWSQKFPGEAPGQWVPWKDWNICEYQMYLLKCECENIFAYSHFLQIFWQTSSIRDGLSLEKSRILLYIYSL